MNIYFLIAAALSAAITALHTFAGGPAIARPLLATTTLEPAVRFVNYYCWHLVTICLALMAAAFGWAAALATAWEAAALATIMAAGFCAWGVMLPLLKGQSYKDIPQGWLFLPVAILGVVGFLS